MKRSMHAIAATILAGTLGLAGVVRADADDDEKKAEKELEEAEGEQKKGQKPGEGAEGQPGAGGLEENPLPKILELMKNVEGRLFEADTGDFTQDEQRQIVEAMKFEEKTHEALEELIRKIEEQMQKQQQRQQSQSSSSDQQQQKSQQNQNETPEQKRQREQEEQRRREREKREEEQRRMQQQQNQSQKQDQKPENDRQQRSEQEQKEGRPPQDDQNPLDDSERRAGRWGQLPRKLHQDASNAANQPPPDRWRSLIERYRERLSEVEGSNPR